MLVLVKLPLVGLSAPGLEIRSLLQGELKPEGAVNEPVLCDKIGSADHDIEGAR